MPAVKKTISYTNLDGEKVSEDWWFSLGQTDMIEMDVTHMKDREEFLAAIVKDNNTRNLLDLWKDMLFKAVGRREGNYLVKDGQILKEFVGSGAYEALYEEIANSDDAGWSFFQTMMPDGFIDKAAEASQQEKSKKYSTSELLNMSDEEFYKAAGTDRVQDMDKFFMAIAMKRLTDSKAA